MSRKLIAFLQTALQSEPDMLLPLSGAARGAAVGFRPMAVLCDERQAFKPATPAAAQAPAAHRPLTPAAGNTRPAARQAQATAANTASPRRSARVLQQGGGRMVLSGRLADVCAEIERLVRIEDQHCLPAS